MVATVKPMSQVGDGGEPSQIGETTTMNRLLTAAFAVVAALAALVSVLTPPAGAYQHRANRPDSYEIALNPNSLAAKHQMGTAPRLVNCDEPA